MKYFLDVSGQVVVIGVAAFLAQLIGYMMTTLLIIYGFRLFWNKGLSQYKIQQRTASRADIGREIMSSLRTLLIFSLVYAGLHLGTRAHVFTVYLGVGPLGFAYMLASAVAMIVAHDAYFYWTHRLMHQPRLYRWFHRTHHKSVTPTVFACYAFDVPEAIVHGLFVPIWLLVFPMQLAAIWFALSFMFTINALGHSGVELFAGAGRSRWFGWWGTCTGHDLHHSTFHYNYALYFTWWDRWMGTDHPLSRHQAREIPASGAVEVPGIPMAETAR